MTTFDGCPRNRFPAGENNFCGFCPGTRFPAGEISSADSAGQCYKKLYKEPYTEDLNEESYKAPYKALSNIGPLNPQKLFHRLENEFRDKIRRSYFGAL